jgi:hypothetical protein
MSSRSPGTLRRHIPRPNLVEPTRTLRLAAMALFGITCRAMSSTPKVSCADGIDGRRWRTEVWEDDEQSNVFHKKWVVNS